MRKDGKLEKWNYTPTGMKQAKKQNSKYEMNQHSDSCDISYK